ncbi:MULTISPECIES: hypothetical protein [Flavobacterium]|uniref:Uncharacterized protein n=2 Tax=Flavobacterium columnare TaxID=996 RepID=A0AA94JQB8_9FLAO|nr:MULTISPECIES: hypothetical protein [Flavobacterium]MCH4829778.1 hypothetical protein [Flavobacterium columnare]MCH4831243.1 hypothetical protein [Flavobacterium columnare]MCH4831575.1 hypothetical protein [Flavobacterium columnare]MCH4832885.1 hypothetical protein [Flavobacterium columnare]MCH4832921.1 hypothetical protein [Flavobacterium columnare]
MRDILLDDNGDLRIENGDFVMGDCQEQNVKLLFASSPAEWKEHLEAGIAFNRTKNGVIDRFMDRTIRVQFDADGFKVNHLKIEQTGVTIDGNYE